MNTPECLACRDLHDCELLGKPPKTDENMVAEMSECPMWNSVGMTEYAVRQRAFEISGLSAISAIRDIDIQLQEDPMPEEKPDIRVAEGGETYRQRSDHLRYETDDSGEFILDPNGERIARGTFWLREYAVDPEGPVRADPSVVWFWSRKQLIDAILASEKEQGLVLSASDMRKSQSKVGKKKPAKERTMKKINIRRGSSPIAKAPEEAAAAPTEDAVPAKAKRTRRAPAKAAAAKTKATGKPAPVDAAPAPGMDMGEVMAKMDDMSARIDGISARLDSISSDLGQGVTMLDDLIRRQLAILHDVVMRAVTDSDDNSVLDKGSDLDWWMGGDDQGE